MGQEWVSESKEDWPLPIGRKLSLVHFPLLAAVWVSEWSGAEDERCACVCVSEYTSFPKREMGLSAAVSMSVSPPSGSSLPIDFFLLRSFFKLLLVANFPYSFSTSFPFFTFALLSFLHHLFTSLLFFFSHQINPPLFFIFFHPFLSFLPSSLSSPHRQSSLKKEAMTSYKSAHAFENMHASGLPGRPPLPKNAAPNFSIGSPSGNSNSHNNNNDTTHEGTPTTIGRKRSDSTASTNFFGHQSYSHPHSIGQHSSQAAFSTSFVREQSLALGNLERRQSFDSEAIISPGSNSNNNNNSTSLSWASNTNSTGTPSGHQSNNNNVNNSDAGVSHRLPANSTSNINNRKRDGGDRSPPSGLSLLLKTKDQEDSKDKNQPSSRSNDNSPAFGTGTGSLGRKHGSLSPPPAPIDTKVHPHLSCSFYLRFVVSSCSCLCTGCVCASGDVFVDVVMITFGGKKKKRKKNVAMDDMVCLASVCRLVFFLSLCFPPNLLALLLRLPYLYPSLSFWAHLFVRSFARSFPLRTNVLPSLLT